MRAWRCEKCHWTGPASDLLRAWTSGVGHPAIRCPRCRMITKVRLVQPLLEVVRTTCGRTAQNRTYAPIMRRLERREVDPAVQYGFTDGSSTGSYAAILVRGSHALEYVRHAQATKIRNVAAELMGVALALRWCRAQQPLRVVSDYLGTGLWLAGHQVTSCPLVLARLLTILRLVEERQIGLTFIHHRGHQRDATDFTSWNNRADVLCSRRRRELGIAEEPIDEGRAW